MSVIILERSHEDNRAAIGAAVKSARGAAFEVSRNLDRVYDSASSRRTEVHHLDKRLAFGLPTAFRPTVNPW